MRWQLGDTVQAKHPMTPQLLKVMFRSLEISTGLDSNVWAVALLLFSFLGVSVVSGAFNG